MRWFDFYTMPWEWYTSTLCLENSITMTPKRRLWTSVFACLCVKKSLLIETSISFLTFILSSYVRNKMLGSSLCFHQPSTWSNHTPPGTKYRSCVYYIFYAFCVYTFFILIFAFLRFLISQSTTSQHKSTNKDLACHGHVHSGNKFFGIKKIWTITFITA